MTITLTPTRTVADLVIERPARARLFEELRIDYCCGGKRSLADACAARGLALQAVLAALEASDASADDAHLVEGTVPELCEHIVATHHEYLRAELPRIAVLLDKCVRAHGADRPELVDVRATFLALREALEDHLHDEERNVFPACVRVAEGAEPDERFAAAVASLEDEHLEAGLLLERLSDLTGAYALEGAACNTHRATLDALAELERDLHRHIHEENNVLFPRVLELAA